MDKMKTNPNDSACPTEPVYHMGELIRIPTAGLTKRELFAATLMGHLISGSKQWDDGTGNQVLTTPQYAVLACEAADALIEALNESETTPTT